LCPSFVFNGSFKFFLLLSSHKPALKRVGNRRRKIEKPNHQKPY
jgi:hypothetical protein